MTIQPIQKMLPVLFSASLLALSVQQAIGSETDEFTPLSGDEKQYMMKFKAGSTIQV